MPKNLTVRLYFDFTRLLKCERFRLAPTDVRARVRALFPGNPTLDFQTLDLVVVETEKLHIPVPFRAVPSPRITWHKDGRELKADDRLSFRSAASLSFVKWWRMFW